MIIQGKLQDSAHSARRPQNAVKWPLLAAMAALTVVIGLVACTTVPKDSGVLEMRRAEAVNMVEIKRRAAAHGLVSLTDVDPTILVDLRYARRDNVTGHILYPPNLPCLVTFRTARKLQKAQTWLKERGYSLRVWDAWRPPEAHLKLWNKAASGLYVSNPSKGWSKHCFGRAVDVTLTDLEGKEMEMPSEFDDFSPQAYFVYRGPDDEIGHRLRLLQKAMGQAGFTYLDTEWWHFNDAVDGEKLKGEPVYGKALGL
jgi:zinc D-Ala-D-Ala dipeptidase